MLAFNYLGKLGRLGNQMFQYAALKGIAAKHNYEWCIPPSNFNHPYYEHQLFEIFNLNSLKNINYLPENYPLLLELKFESAIYFDNDILNNCPDNIILGGYFQSEKYFKHIENEIRQDFTFNNQLLNFCQKIIEEFENCISIHIRRTDFIPINMCLDIDYYLKGLKYFDNEKVIVFSDDIEWCKNQEIFQSERFFISPFENNSIDLCLMTLCSGHIIANSTFSWWGAWLSNSKKIVAPSKWYSKTKEDTKDIVPESWIKI